MKRAVEKLNFEMRKDKSPFVQVVGQFLLRHLESDPAAAEKIMPVSKSIAGSLSEMRKEAEKRKVGNVAVLSDEEGFAAVMKYFGIEGRVKASSDVKVPEGVEEKASAGFSASLDDFL